MENERHIGSDWTRGSATAQRGPMAMKVKVCLLAPLIPLKAADDQKPVALMVWTYCGQPAVVSAGETTTQGGLLKVPEGKSTLIRLPSAYDVYPVPATLDPSMYTYPRMMRRFSVVVAVLVPRLSEVIVP